MPKDNIERAIKKGEGNDPDSNFEEVRYEGYGPDGIAIIVEALTNNKNRTAAEIRSTFNKYGGNLGESGSVSFSFKRLGSITLNKNNINEEELFDFIVENGNGLNPLLQNVTMAIHPPMLYLGYVGFTVPFAFAFSALVNKDTGVLWIRSIRRWTLVTWLFLSIGIILGGWWAYQELGGVVIGHGTLLKMQALCPG